MFAPIGIQGRSTITPRDGGEVTVEWGKRDLFVVPSWRRVRHQAAADSVLFSFFDPPIQQALDLFREDRGNA